MVEPESTAAALGSDVVLSCSAVVVDVGSGSLLTYWWSLAGHRDSLPVKALQFLNHSLYVPSVSHEDEGL